MKGDRRVKYLCGRLFARHFLATFRVEFHLTIHEVSKLGSRRARIVVKRIIRTHSEGEPGENRHFLPARLDLAKGRRDAAIGQQDSSTDDTVQACEARRRDFLPRLKTAERDESYTVMRPVYETSNRTENYTVLRPVTTYQTQYVDQSVVSQQTVLKPSWPATANTSTGKPITAMGR